MAVAVLVAMPVFSQIGQYPPGQYPQGRYPQGQSGPMGPGGISLPHRTKKGKAAEKKKDAVPNFNVDGVVISSTGTKLELGTNDGRLIKLTVDQDTKFTRDGAVASFAQAPENTFVHVEAFEDQEWFLTAATVDIRKPPADKASASPAADGAANTSPAQPKPANTSSSADPSVPPSPDTLGAEPDVPGRPKLHHGKPTAEETAGEPNDSETPPVIAKSSNRSASSPDQPKDDAIDFTIGDEKTEAKRKPSAYNDLIARTREWSEAFSQGLPNFVCEQLTTRYMESSKAEGFQPQDVLSAKVVYEDGKENYQQITVGGKRTNKSMMELGGSTSTGEFASTLRSLFSGYVNAEFKFQESSSVAKTPVGIYTLKVLLPHSDWTILMGSQQLRPAYSGTVWVDKASAEVRHIEIQADNVPKNFPGDTIAMTVDYEPVSLGSRKFLLPVHSENLTCFRGTSICSKNTIDFRDYHKYSGESTVEFK